MSRGKYAGQPYSFRCRGCREHCPVDSVEFTGKTRKQKSAGGNYRYWPDVAIQYTHACGHAGWSRHPWIAKLFKLRQENES